MERTAVAQRAFSFERTPHLFHKLTSDGRAQARASETAANRDICLREGGEDELQLLPGHADTRIPYLNVNHARFVCKHHLDAACVCELDGVTYKVIQDLQNPERVALEVFRDILGILNNEVELLSLRRQTQGRLDLHGHRL